MTKNIQRLDNINGCLQDSQCGSDEAKTPPQVWKCVIGNLINCQDISPAKCSLSFW